MASLTKMRRHSDAATTKGLCCVHSDLVRLQAAICRIRREEGCHGCGSWQTIMRMNDATTDLAEIKERVLAFAQERDWEQFHAPKNLSMAIAAEAAELMEHFLWQSPNQSRIDIDAETLRAKVEEELADIFIYAIEFANVTGIDIASIIEKKMALNAKKYPVEKAKGRSEKYTDL